MWSACGDPTASAAEGKSNWRPLCRRRVWRSRSSTDSLMALMRPLGCRLFLSDSPCVFPFQQATELIVDNVS